MNDIIKDLRRVIVLPGELHLLGDGPDVGESLAEDDEDPLGAAAER